MCDRAVFMRQRFCDEIRRVNVSSHKAFKPVSSTTAADVRPSMLTAQSSTGWLQLSPVRSPVIAPTENTQVEEHSFLSNYSGSNSAASSRAGSFSSSRDEAGVNAAATT